MAELPASWKLKTRKRADGKLDVMGKTDVGEDYKVRTCESGAVTESDVQAIKECDREQYRSREEGAREFVKSLIDAGKAYRNNQERVFGESLEEAAGPVVRTGFGRERSTVGSTCLYRQNYDAVFGEN